MTLDRADAVPPPLIPSGSALNPMVLDRRMLLPVLDTNALLVEACALAKHGGRQDRVTALAVTGRATPYIAAHVPGEADEHLAKVAADLNASEGQARRVLNEQILPALRVVDLEIRDHLAPQTRHILRVDPKMPRRYRGDPDDAPTMALAEFFGAVRHRLQGQCLFPLRVRRHRLDPCRRERAAPGRPGSHRCERAGTHRYCVPAVRCRC
ncbi:hypothetical protein [Streptomyces sp. NPDC127066]|uniref:hypothetical protein n=1 Tax=Streptomyces sp. NPDC127066 TaxID=3347125 RepID=UPI003651C70E